jgi:nitroreductase
MDAYQCIVSKRDLRAYDGRPIEPSTLRRILEAGRRTGSSRNQQPWSFIVVTDRDVLRALARCGRFSGHVATAAAAVVIVVEHAANVFDAGRCAQSMMLAAWALGVASCPVTLQDEDAVRAAIAPPATAVVATTIALGYPHPRGRTRLERLGLRLIARSGRKPLRALVHWNKYGTAPVSAFMDEIDRRGQRP